MLCERMITKLTRLGCVSENEHTDGTELQKANNIEMKYADAN